MIEIATKSKEQQDSQKTEEELCGFSLGKSDGEDPREVDSMVVIEKPVEISVVKHDPFQSGQKVTVSQQPKSVIEQSEPSKELETELRNSSVIEKLAKDQFMKWTEIGNMIQQIESRLGAKAASEMQELLFKVEKFTEQSKQGLKEKYLRGGDRIASSNPWEVKSRRSEDHALRHSLNESEFQGEMKKIREDSNASVSARNYPRWATRRSTECSRRTKWRSGLKPTSK